MGSLLFQNIFGGTAWFAPTAITFVHLAVFPEAIPSLNGGVAIGSLLIVLLGAIYLVWLRRAGSLDLAIVAAFAAAPIAKGLVDGVLGIPVIRFGVVSVFISAIMIILASGRRGIEMLFVIVALIAWTGFMNANSFVSGGMLILSALCAGLAQFLFSGPRTQSIFRVFLDQILFASLAFTGCLYITDGLGFDTWGVRLIQIFAIGIAAQQVGLFIYRRQYGPIAVAIAWTALATVALTMVTGSDMNILTDRIYPSLMASVLVLALSGGLTAIFLKRRAISDFTKIYFVAFSISMLAIVMLGGMQQNFFGLLQPGFAGWTGVQTASHPLVLASGYVICLLVLIILYLPRAKHKIPFWVGFLHPRTAAVLRRITRSSEDTIYRLPFVSSLGAIIAAAWMLLRHLRGPNAIPIISEAVFGLIALTLWRLMANTGALSILIDAQGKSDILDYSIFTALVAQCIQFGIGAFLIGRLLPSRFFSYAGLAAILAPIVLVLFSLFDFNLREISGSLMALSFALVFCEIIRVIVDPLRTALSTNATPPPTGELADPEPE